MSKVKLLTNGMFVGMNAVVGKTFTAVKDGGTWDIKVTDLIAAGYITDGSKNPTLCWFNSEVEVIEK